MMTETLVFIFILISFFNLELCLGEREMPNLKEIVKTIHGEHDVINCVDIYQQPAFDHPLLNDHKIQMMTPQFIRPQSNTYEELFFNPTSNEIDECPEGTVPIQRSEEVHEELLMKMKGGSTYSNVFIAVPNPLIHEYATVTADEGTYYGTKFAATVWNPHVEPNELSLAQTWITAGPYNSLNAIEVGWMVYPSRYKDNRTRLFTFWTTDGYKTICYDQRCPGYVQLSRKVFPGAPLSPVSQYGSQNYAVWITIFKAKGNWYLQVGDEVVGYWPANIFPLLKDSASHLVWGGEVVHPRNDAHHTTTQMGSGHYANEKYSKAALFYNLQVNTREDNPIFERPKAVHPVVTKENCYNLLTARYDKNLGDHFFFGGPGYSKICP